MAGLALLQSDECLAAGATRNCWKWREAASTCFGLRGAALLAPEVAQHTEAIRLPKAISDKEIALLVAAAEQHKLNHAGDAKLTGSSDAPGKLYLHHNGCDPTILPIVARIEALVRRTDRENWGLLADRTVLAGKPMTPRCVEFHEYVVGGRDQCLSHYDAGSLFTADVMLCETSEFEGGEMHFEIERGEIRGEMASGTTASDEVNDEVSDEASRGEERVESRGSPPFGRGDVLVFLSHKAHGVHRLRSGRRIVLVIEFWQGGACRANHRCCDGGCGGKDAQCGNEEGAATFDSRYYREPLLPDAVPETVPEAEESAAAAEEAAAEEEEEAVVAMAWRAEAQETPIRQPRFVSRGSSAEVRQAQGVLAAGEATAAAEAKCKAAAAPAPAPAAAAAAAATAAAASTAAVAAAPPPPSLAPPAAFTKRRLLHDTLVAQGAVVGGRVPPVWWQSAGVGAELAVELATRFYCVLDGFISPCACAELQVTSL